jgi:hypothetical protein
MLAATRDAWEPMRGKSPEEAVGELLRTPLPRASVNKPPNDAPLVRYA